LGNLTGCLLQYLIFSSSMGTAMVRMRTIASLLLLAQLCAADRYILQAVLDCSTVHPSCVSCSVKRTSTNGLVGNSELICKGCTSPGYQLDDAASTCGEQGQSQPSRSSTNSTASMNGCLTLHQQLHTQMSAAVLQKQQA
jgi:hypothetical protein